MTDEFRYWGFISYSHADEAIAGRLHRALESYSLPAGIARAHGLPRRLIPIFRDVEELEAAAGLGQRLRRSLDESRWLIVLCSPSAAKSRYVNDEIEHFSSRHGAGQILCVLVEGEPAESFPPALRALGHERPVADLRATAAFETGKLQVVATMAVVGYSELQQREQERQRRTRMAAGAAAAAIVLGSLSAWDLYAREQSEYYANYVRRDGIWQGVDRVSASAASHRALTWRFTRRGRLNPPDRVQLVNGHGRCSLSQDELGYFSDLLGEQVRPNGLSRFDPPRDYCTARFTYVGDGAMHEEVLEDGWGVARFSLIYTRPGLAEIVKGGFNDASEGGGIRYVEFVRDERGFDRELHFLHGPGEPRRNAAFAYGYRYEYDDSGRRLRMLPLDARLEPIAPVERYAYSAHGELTQTGFEDRTGRPHPGATGEFSVLIERDRWGNAASLHNRGRDGEPVVNLKRYASLKRTFSDAGDLETICAFDAQGQPADVNPYGACQRSERDALGQATRVGNYGIDGKLSPNVIAPLNLIRVGAHGEILESRMLDANEQPVGAFGGWAVQHRTYDSRGNLLRYDGTDGAGKRTLLGAGAAIVREYDSHDRLIRHAYLDLNDRPMVGSFGMAWRRYERDARGNVTAECIFGADGKPMLALPAALRENAGYACMHATLDEAGNAVETRYEDTTGRLVRTARGYAGHRSSFDALGQETSRAYFGADGAPCADNAGVFGYRQSFNPQGLVAEKTWLDRAGKPAAMPGTAHTTERYAGYFKVGNTFPIRHQYARVEFLDGAGNLLGREERTYDPYGNPLEIRRYDASGALAPSPVTGCAILRTQYTYMRDPELEACFDASERPVNRKDQGWSRHAVRYEQGKALKQEYFDAAGKPVAPRG